MNQLIVEDAIRSSLMKTDTDLILYGERPDLSTKL